MKHGLLTWDREVASSPGNVLNAAESTSPWARTMLSSSCMDINFGEEELQSQLPTNLVRQTALHLGTDHIPNSIRTGANSSCRIPERSPVVTFLFVTAGWSRPSLSSILICSENNKFQIKRHKTPNMRSRKSRG